MVSAASGEPIAGSSVFITNTSKGTVSDKQGNFQLDDVPLGKNDLVISSVGYETNVFSFSAEQLPLQLRVEMQLKVRELANVTVEPSVEEGWDRWGKTFLDNFVGQTPNAAKVTIKNQKAIHFRYYKKSNRVIAYSDEPLILENKALGYKVRFQLEDFEVNFKEGSSAFAGFSLFEEIKDKSKGKWLKARNKAYYGSMLHFMRSIYNNTILEQGFEVRRMVRSKNEEKERVKKVYRTQHSIGNTTISITGAGTSIAGGAANDSSDYYRRILSQKDYVDTYGRELLVADSLIIEKEEGYKILFFNNYLFITYKKETEEKEYLLYHRESRSPGFQTSYIWLQHGNPVAIDANGNCYPPQEIYAMSYWGWSEKIADLLPLDFIPGDKVKK